MCSSLPEILQDKTNLTLEKCLNKTLSIDIKPFVTVLIDKLSDDILYEKAKQIHLLDEGYNLCKTREEKIRFIKNGIKMHKIKATKKCIKEITDTKIEYRDWFEYDGVYNHFKILIFVNDDFSKISQIQKNIESKKRLSAKEEMTIVINNSENKACVGSRYVNSIVYKALPQE